MQHYGNENWAGTPLHTDSVQCRCIQSQRPNKKLNCHWNLKRIDKKFWKWYKNEYHSGYDNANKF